MSAPIKIAVCLNHVKQDAIVRVAQAAEQLGYHNVWLGEHIAMPATDWWVDHYAFMEARKAGKTGEALEAAKAMATAPRVQFGDPMTILAAIAAATSKIRLGTGIYLLPMRNPIVAARAITAVDNISGGRLDLGVGLGWSRKEFEFTETDWATRGKRFEESIKALRVLFSEREPEFHGDLIKFGPTGFEPKPMQSPLPIRLGGMGPVGIRRAALLGDGWFGYPDRIAEIKEMREEAGLAGEPYDFIALAIYAHGAREVLEKLAGQGADYAGVSLWQRRVGLEAIDMLEDYAREVGLEP